MISGAGSGSGIAAGGGGIPVYVEIDGSYEGIDAVIDKDRASAILARDINAQTFLVLTNVDYVYINYNTPLQEKLEEITVSKASKYLAEGQFPAGSMGPKIEAAISFLESGGKEVIITSMDKAKQAILGKAGTRIIKDQP